MGLTPYRPETSAFLSLVSEPTFDGNARLKALSAATQAGLPALADDFGLEVDCLGGAPGTTRRAGRGRGKISVWR